MVSAGTTEFLSLLAILFGGGMIGAWLMHKIRFPTIIGFILVGIIVGPYGLSVIDNAELVNLLAEFGIIILLFVVGLEFSINKLRRVGLSGVIIGTVQLGIVFFLGYIVAVALGWSHLEALFLGSILSITSTAISLRFLRDLNLVNTKEWDTVITILIIEDLAAVLLLTLLGNASAGDNFAITDVGSLIIQSILFFVLTLAIGIKIVPKLLERVSKINMEEAPFITALALTFGLAVLAHFLGLSSAIGAFLMGMIIASSKFSEKIIPKVLPLKDFFIVIFFVSIGMLVNITLIPDAIWIAIPIVIVAIFGKFIGNMFAASMSGNTFISATTIGAMMIPIGEFSFIIAKLGVDSGSINESIYPVTIVVSLTTMLAMPLLLRSLPTIADQRSIIPKKLLNYIFFAGRFVGAGSLKEKTVPQISKKNNFKKYGPTILVHFIIITSLLALLNYFTPSIISLLEDPDVPFFMSPSIFLGILTSLIIAYPIFLVIGKTEGIIDKISNTITIRYGQKEKQLINKPIHRVLRDIIFIGLILLLVAIFISFVDFQIENAKVIISTIGFAVMIPLFLDIIFSIRKLTQTHLFDNWLSSDDEK
ncbi:cation:proton antiporter [Nitrosopumilus sp.]|uniref:cation:proton antiporter domain-containing protein n=1 Tax=Nitrosopumilus sp. TaxID=2024843 RepID=UPI00349FDE29